MKRLGFFILFTLSSLSANAGLSPDWIEAPAFAPQINVWISRRSPNSTFSVQAPSASDARVQKLFRQWNESKSEKIESLLPHECYRLQRPDLESSQTWCRSSNGAIRNFVELGSTKMKETEKVELQLRILSEAK